MAEEKQMTYSERTWFYMRRDAAPYFFGFVVGILAGIFIF